ncbi:MAG: flagellar basal body rod protein FlgB [Leptospirales bacterium]|nr:flagellar basal body rod protein FlgB [Leptospirales bacterium]
MRSLKLLEMGLSATSARRDVIANNIANVDVPGFKRSEVSFEADLRRAIDSERDFLEQPKLETIHPGHVDGRRPRDYRTVEAKSHTDFLSTMRADGNNVDMEDEISKMTRNQMQYSLYVDRIGAQFRNWNSFIRMA